MRLKLLLLFAISCISIASIAQNVGIGTNSPSTGAKLDIQSSDNGILIPRVALVATNDTAPIVGVLDTSLLVYNTTTNSSVKPGFYYWDGRLWDRLLVSRDSASVDNGLEYTIPGFKVQLGGDLVKNTTITQGTNNMIFDLDGTGDFVVQDGGTNHFSVNDNGDSYFGSDVYWKDENTLGINLAVLSDDDNDGRFRIYENGTTSVDLDANTQFIFNEQGLDRNFRIESDANANMLFVDAGNNRVGIGESSPQQSLHVNGNARITNLAGTGSRMVIADANGDLATQAIPANGDITNVTAGTGLTGGGTTGDVTVNAVGTNGLTTNADDIRLGGNLIQATTITQGVNNMTFNLNGTGDFNIQDNGTNQFVVQDNGDVRADNSSFYVDASTNKVGIGTASPAEALHVYRADNDIARVYATGGAQGSGMFYAGQSSTYGGGFVYDGDGAPALVGGTDRVTYFRRDNGTDVDVMSYAYNNSQLRIANLAGTGNRMVIANAAGDLSTQAITLGDITGVTAGSGLSGGGTSGDVTLNIEAMALSASFAFSEDDVSSGNLTSYASFTGDDVGTTVTMPFSVTLGGTNYNVVYISTNGFIEFGAGSGGTDLSNDALPTANHSNPILAAYWDDLVTEGTGIEYGYSGTAPNRVFIITYEARTFSGSNETDFQIQIHEGSSLLNVKYFNMAPGAVGQGATIGYQGAGGSSSTAYPISFNARVLDDNSDDADPSSDSWSICPVR